ncbi:acyl carrier protein [Legionella antarctica]|nr:acyl carrier protein [Legionella antarctica]
MTDAFSDALYFACGKTSGSKATRDYQPRSFLASLAGSDRYQSFDSLGVSSIQAVSILSNLESELKIALPETLFWDCSNVHELTLYIHENYEDVAIF